MERNWNPNDPIPNEFADVLFGDDESDSVEDGDLGLEFSGESDDANIEDMPIVLPNEDGSFAPISSLVEEQLSSEGEDEAYERLREEVHRHISPLSSPRLSPIPGPSHLPPRPEPLPVRFRTQRGSATGRGRGIGGRRGRARNVRGRRGNGWTRGQPLVEKYQSDEEIPAQIREVIRARLVSQNQRALGNVEEEEDDNSDAFSLTDQHFDWKPVGEWEGGQKEVFRPTRVPGPQREVSNAYDSFRAIWDDDILSEIVTETNRFATTIISDAFQREWFDTTIDEVMIMLAFWMMLSIVRMPSIKSCYSKLPLLRTEVFRSLLTEKRYWNLNRALHFASGSSQDNPLHPMGPVLDHLNRRFQELYQLAQDICIDESLTLWKGPIKFRQYIKTKAARYGIKTYQLCESKTGYLWSFFVYCGKGSDSSSDPSSVSTVLRLARPVLGMGHVLYMDNYFNSPLLARYLKKHGTDCVGTLRPNRKYVPAEVQRSPLREGEFIARQSGDLLVIGLVDRKRLELISTCHGLSQALTDARPGHRPQYRFNLVMDYNSGMGGVDRLDQMLEPYLIERKQCRKWTKKLFKRLVNMSIQNSRILLEKSTSCKIDSLLYRLSLVQEIINRHLVSSTRQRAPVVQRGQTFPICRLTERHFIRRMPITEEMLQNIKHKSNLGRKYCVLCKRSKTSYWCPKCELPLCLEECFEKFHTVADL